MNALLFQSDRTRERVELVSRTDFVQPLSRNQRRLLEILDKHYGRSRAITVNQIGARLQLAPREVKELVAQLRSEPYMLPVCASRDGVHGGYYLAQTDEERRAAAKLLIHQAHSMMVSASHLLDQQELAQAMAPILSMMQGGMSRG